MSSNHLEKYISDSQILQDLLSGAVQFTIKHNINNSSVSYKDCTFNSKLYKWWKLDQDVLLEPIAIDIDYADVSNNLDQYNFVYDKKAIVRVYDYLMGTLDTVKLPYLKIADVSSTIINDFLATTLYLAITNKIQLSRAYLQSLYLLIKISSLKAKEMTSYISDGKQLTPNKL